ncbi:MAG: hypothetical protein NXY59_06455 [Aigarchaeota archaeon]|nr:hypothetical protein [Candidatus Pelearchaeum maunauluense]
MTRFLIYVQLSNNPDAIAKMMLLVKQGQLSLEGATIASTDSGARLSAILTLIGTQQKAEWLTKKLLNYPFFHQAWLLRIQ